MDPAKNKPKKSAGENESDSGLQTLKITTETDRLLTAHSKKLKLSKRKYANAAIAYFAETGLNPTKERPHGLASVSSRVSQETLAVRELNIQIGNRVILIMRGWEKMLYGFLQQQQAGTLNYLQQIESNILAHQVEVEKSLLSPMVEQLLKGNIETSLMRGLTTYIYLGKDVPNQPTERFRSQQATLDAERDEHLALQLREFIKTNSVAKPTLSPKPQVPAIPPKAPITPGGSTPAAGAAQK